NDFALIKVPDEMELAPRRLTPVDTYRIHSLSMQFLVTELSQKFDGLTIVMTHHAPSLQSVPPDLQSDPLTPCYASALDHLIENSQPDPWVHGHIHSSNDYYIGKTRVVCNPRGYHPAHLNPAFDPSFTIELR